MFVEISEFKPVTKEICKLPSFFSPALFKKIDANSTGIVTRYHCLSTFLFASADVFHISTTCAYVSCFSSKYKICWCVWILNIDMARQNSAIMVNDKSDVKNWIV